MVAVGSQSRWDETGRSRRELTASSLVTLRPPRPLTTQTTATQPHQTPRQASFPSARLRHIHRRSRPHRRHRLSFLALIRSSLLTSRPCPRCGPMASSSSAATSSKRRRASQSSASPFAVAVVEKWSSFFNDPEADVILRSVDGRLFATRQAYLIAASSVLEDMFKIPQPPGEASGRRWKKKGQVAPGVLPVVEMAERGKRLELFLRWIHRDTFDDLYAHLDMTTYLKDTKPTLLHVLECARKYDAKAVCAPAFKLVEKYLKTDTANVLALAILYDQTELAHGAMIEWAEDIYQIRMRIYVDPESISAVRKKGHRTGQSGPWAVSDIFPDLITLLPPGFAFHASKIAMDQFFAKEFCQFKAAKEFIKAWDDGFPLECTWSSFLYVILLSYPARTRLILHRAFFRFQSSTAPHLVARSFSTFAPRCPIHHALCHRCTRSVPRPLLPSFAHIDLVADSDILLSHDSLSQPPTVRAFHPLARRRRSSHTSRPIRLGSFARSRELSPTPTPSLLPLICTWPESCSQRVSFIGLVHPIKGYKSSPPPIVHFLFSSLSLHPSNLVPADLPPTVQVTLEPGDDELLRLGLVRVLRCGQVGARERDGRGRGRDAEDGEGDETLVDGVGAYIIRGG